MSVSSNQDALTDRRLRVIIDDLPGDPFFNVALEEAIIRANPHKPVMPTLRLWRCGESVVMGYGRRVDDDVFIKSVESDGIPLVRRSSGGGTVYHHPDNFCYSFYLPYAWKELKPRERFADSVRLLCGLIEKTIKKCGFSAEISNRGDIIIEGRKFSGTAQQRVRYSMCHHGTILMTTHSGEMDRYLKIPTGRQSKHSEFCRGLLESGYQGEAWDIYRKLIDVSCDRLNLKPFEGNLTDEEKNTAGELEQHKYRRMEFIKRFQ